MATDVLNTDLRVGPNGLGLPANRGNQIVVQQTIDLDWSEILPSVNDLIALFDIPIGLTVLQVGCRVLEATTTPASGCTVDIGDYDNSASSPAYADIDAGDTITIIDVDGWHDGLDIHTAALVAESGTYAIGKCYTTRCMLGLLILGDNPENGILRVSMTGFLACPNWHSRTLL